MYKCKCIFLTAVIACLFFTGQAVSQVPADDLQKIESAVQELTATQPSKPRRLLIFTRAEGFKHSSIPYAAAAIKTMGKKSGAFAAVVSDKMDVFAPESLAGFDAVLFASTTRLAFENMALRASLMDFVKSGKGVAGIHAATDNFYTWAEAADMMGGTFDGHPWNSKGKWAFKVEDVGHPLTASFKEKQFSLSDEIYRIRHRKLRENARVLVALNMKNTGNLQARGVRVDDVDVPVSWVRELEKGRVFYSSFGHNHEIFWNQEILQHFLSGIQFALGDLAVDTTPVPFNQSSLDFTVFDNMLERAASYKYGESRKDLVDISAFLRLVNDNTGLLAQAEKKLLAVLQSDATLDAKAFICDRLSLYASAQSIPVLASLLSDPTIFEKARFALERIELPEATQALENALLHTSGASKIALITSLGHKQDTNSLVTLGLLMKDRVDPVAHAAIAAVGRFGTIKSTAVLSETRKSAPAARRIYFSDALLNSAATLASAGRLPEAATIYKNLRETGESEEIKFAAFRGLILSDDSQAAEILVGEIKDRESGLRETAIRLVRDIPHGQDISAILHEFPSFSEVLQVQLIAAVAHRRDDPTRTAIVAATASSAMPVQRAATQALSTVGDATTVLRLAEIAAQNPLLQQDARNSLYRIRDAAVDASILKLIPGASSKIKIELLRAIAQRQIKSGTSLLIEVIGSGEARERTESIKSLKVVAQPKHFPTLVGLLKHAQTAAERKQWEVTLPGVARKMDDTAFRSQALIRELASTSEGETKASLLFIIGAIGEEQSLPVLRAALKSENSTEKAAAIRALSQWPNISPSSDLKAIAAESQVQVHQVLAVRGFIQLIGRDSMMPDEERVASYAEAMQLAKGNNEKKQVLSGLGTVPSEAALAMVVGYFGTPSFKDEAHAAALKISALKELSFSKKAKAAVKDIVASSQREAVVNQGKRLLRKFEKFDDYLVKWQVSGVYKKANANIFNFAFAPEQDDASHTADWRTMPASSDGNRPWLLELDKVLGGENCVAYLRNRIWSEKEQKARLELGSDDGIKVWLNNEVVHANNATRGVNPGEDVVNVVLKSGWNTLLLKVVQGGGGWGACARFRRPDGSKLEGLKIGIVEEPEPDNVEVQEAEANNAKGVNARLKTLGVVLKTPPQPTANFVRAVRTGNLVFLAGHGSRKKDGSLFTGKLGQDLNVEQGKKAARSCAIGLLSSLQAEIGDLNKVTRIVKVLGMVNAKDDFTGHSQVMNGFSDFIVAVFGQKGKHARAAVGMGSLPGNLAVEIEMIVEIED